MMMVEVMMIMTKTENSGSILLIYKCDKGVRSQRAILGTESF